jgi:ketosteroid isomerase-like protein
VQSANVAVVRRAVESFNRRDLDAVMRDSDPDVEVDWSRSRGVEAGVYRGHREVQDFWGTFLDVFESVTVIPDEFMEHGEHVVMPNRSVMAGRQGITVEAHSVAVATLRDGHILRWRLYHDRSEALRAAGLAR